MSVQSGVRYSARLEGEDLVWLRDAVAGVAVAISRSRGELISLQVGGCEVLDRGGRLGPAAPASRWRGRAPILFPAVGRQRDGGRWRDADGVERCMPIHGFAWSSERWECVAVTTDAAAGASTTVGLAHTEATADAEAWAAYPFPCNLAITYHLACGALSLRHTVTNNGTRELPFALGNHLTLQFPLPLPPSPSAAAAASAASERDAAAAWASGTITTSCSHEHLLSSGSLLTGEVRPLDKAESTSTAGEEEAAVAILPLTAPSATNGVFGCDPASPLMERASGACWMQVADARGSTFRVAHSYRVSAPAHPAGGGGGGGGGAGAGAGAAAVAAAAPAVAGAGPSLAANEMAVNAGRLFVLWGVPPPVAGAEEAAVAATDVPSTTSPAAYDAQGPSTPAAARPGFLSLEPWLSGPDSLNTGVGLARLPPGAAGHWTVRMEARLRSAGEGAAFIGSETDG